MENIAISVRDVSKVYRLYDSNIDRLKELFLKRKYHREFVANRGVSFDLYEGETLGIIGVNGAGKSTLLKMISGIIEPSGGVIHRRGRVSALLELGSGFNEELSGRDNIYLNGTLIGMSHRECEQNADAIIEFSELGAHIDDKLKTYSSGMKMRLAFSIALFSRPDVLIVDEALSVGDAHFSAKCTMALRERKRERMSIIYVSHDLNSLKVLCDRVVMMDGGEVVEVGDSESVCNSYYQLISRLNENHNIRSDNKSSNSFGTFLIEIKSVRVYGQNSGSDVISSGDVGVIEIELESHIKSDDVTIGVHIRDRYGQDIYGSNSYLQDVVIEMDRGRYVCKYKMAMNIGVGRYSVGCAVHSGVNHLEHCYHWFDGAAAFEMVGDGKSLGLCYLESEIDIKEVV